MPVFRSAVVGLALTALLSCGQPAQAATVTPCIGDCQGSGTSSIDSLVTIVRIALGDLPRSACALGLPVGAPVTVDVIVQAVDHTLAGCPQTDATPTLQPSIAPSSTPSPTSTTTVGSAGCPAGQHRACHGGSGRGGGYRKICTCVNDPPPVCLTAWGARLQAGTTVLVYDTTLVYAPDTCAAHATPVSCSSTGALSPPGVTGYLVCTVMNVRGPDEDGG